MIHIPERLAPAWQVFVASLLIFFCGVWLFWTPVGRTALALLLLGSTVLVLLYVGGKITKGRHPATELLAVFILVFDILFTLVSIDIAGILMVWVLVMILFLIFLAVIGIFITGRPLGLIIDSRERMSLATLQTILWTVILLSAFFTVAAGFIQAGKPENAFDIGLQPELWALLGISVTTLAGTPLIIDLKTERTVDPRALQKYGLKIRGKIVENARKMGKLDRYFTPTQLDTMTTDELYEGLNLATPKVVDTFIDDFRDGPVAIGPCTGDKPEKPASFLDLFRGYEIVDCHRVDLGKVQMFFFTIIGALAYMFALGGWIATLTPEALAAAADAASAANEAALAAAVNATGTTAAHVAAVSFPLLSAGFIGILGISHAGFLGNTAVNKTPAKKE